MKFRHFEFKLFPKLKNKKKKKSKLCNTDFPRDIGLDKNFNYSKTSFQEYYDNLGADDNLLCRHVITPQDTNFGHTRYRTYPLPELKIEVGSLCQCVKCTDTQHPDSKSTWICVSAPEADQTGSDASAETPNTIPRTRTRIKTNPWLPSPRATPSPSPTDPFESILFSSSEFVGSTKSCPVNSSKSRDENSSFYWTCNTAHNHAPLFSSNNGLIKIAEHENDTNDVEDNNLIPNAPAKITEEVIRITGTKAESIEQLTLDLITETGTLSSHAVDTNGKKRFSFTEFLKYDTDGSTCTSPIVETIEFLKTVQYDIGFDYEERVDELLETSDFPRDATFMSIKELLEECADKTVDEEANIENEPADQDIDRKHSVEDINSACLTERDNSENGYISDSEDVIDDNIENLNSLSNMDLTCYEDKNMQESIDTGYASVTRDSDSMSSRDDVRSSSDLDLEWDNDPATHHLTIDYRFTSDNSKPLQRPRSMSLDYGCVYNKIMSRSLADIEISLDEKVTRLREEKLYVQHKIQEAIEEDQIRRQQLSFFRSLSPVGRKDMLVKTLNDLKTRLENQSARLQASYDMVLSLQRKFTARRKTLPTIDALL